VKEYWQMTRDEYYGAFPLKPRKELTVNLISRQVKVIQNPTDSDIGRMAKEVRDQFPEMAAGDGKIRSTCDRDGNNYIWKAHEALHFQIENTLEEMVGATLDQGIYIPTHAELVGRAVDAGKEVPPEVLADYPYLHPEAKEATNSHSNWYRRSNALRAVKTEGYHLTFSSLISGIIEQGLIPSVSNNDGSDYEGIYLFRDKLNLPLEDELELDGDSEKILLTIDITGLEDYLTDGDDGCYCSCVISPNRITLQENI